MTRQSGEPILIDPPEWVDAEVFDFSEPLDTDAQRMHLCIELATLSVERGGGPFGALVFVGDELIAAGVNLVVSTGLSIAHAEIVALCRAQQLRDDLASLGPTLYASTDPCCQCFGALVWAGTRRLVCGATTEDAEAVGFDEGPKPRDWVDVLERRNIAVTREVERTLAREPLEQYRRQGGVIY